MSKLQSTEKLVLKIKNLIKTSIICRVQSQFWIGRAINLLYANSEKKNEQCYKPLAFQSPCEQLNISNDCGLLHLQGKPIQNKPFYYLNIMINARKPTFGIKSLRHDDSFNRCILKFCQSVTKFNLSRMTRLTCKEFNQHNTYIRRYCYCELRLIQTDTMQIIFFPQLIFPFPFVVKPTYLTYLFNGLRVTRQTDKLKLCFGKDNDVET